MSMTIHEATRCLVEDLFPAMPDVADWLFNKSPNPEKTRDIWAAAISKVDRSEVAEVIFRWLSGDEEIQAPKAYERELVPRILISNVMFLRGKNRRKQLQENQANEIGRRMKERTAVMRDVVCTDELWAKHWHPLKAAVLDGSMTQRDALRQWNRIIDDKYRSGQRVSVDD